MEKLDETTPIPLSLLDKINFKYECDELCPFPECLEELHAWELELIVNWTRIEDVISWISIGMPMERAAAWHNLELNDVKRWHNKRKRIGEKSDIYSQWQGFLDYL